MQTNIIVADQGYNGLNPMQFGYQSCPPAHSFGPAIRTHWLIHFVVSGCGTFDAGGKSYRVSAGEMFVIAPYEETFYIADQSDPWSYIWIGFTAHELPLSLDYVIRCPEAQRIFTKMKDCNNLEGGRSAYLSARLWDLFALLLENKSPQPNYYIDKALDCIHSEYMHGITVDEIAKRLNLNRMYFSTLFKKSTGISPKQYLFNYRMNVAATLILHKKASVSVAASSVGYTDVFNFSKMFKRHFGISPSQYAASNQNI